MLRTGPTAFANARCHDPLSSFLAVIEPIENIVVNMTNLYGKNRYKNKWKNVDVVTMRAYYGMLLLAGVYRSKGEDIAELWDDQNGRPIFRATMSLKRFNVINQCIRFDDKEQRIHTSDRDKLQPIRNVFEKWLQRVRALYVPGKTVTVDEQLIPFRGRCPFTQYIPSKPAKYGIKMWVLCDSKSYYAYNMEIYCGRNRNAKPEVKQGERVVLSLTEGLNGRNVTTDNFFTSHSLATELKKRQMTIVGTMRKNRNEIPSVLLDMKSKAPKHSEFVFDHKLRATLDSYVPKKNKYVTLLSTYHTSNKIADADQRKPEIIQFYNATKGAVDTLDEMVGTYRCKRRLLRWPLAVFENMLDISACNALVLFLANNPAWKYAAHKARRRFFLIELGMALVSPFSAKRKTLPYGKRARDVVCDLRGIPREPSANPPLSSQSSSLAFTTQRSQSTWLANLQHQPPTKKRARCYVCSHGRNGNAYTITCDKCQRHICPEHRFSICDLCCGVPGA